MPLDRPRNFPATRRIGGETKESPIIFGIANHHQRVLPLIGRRRDQGIHQFAAQPASLRIGFDRNGADKHQRCKGSICLFQRDRPALQCPDKSAISIGCEAQLCERSNAIAHAIRSPGLAISTKGCIEQCFNSVRPGPVQGKNLNHKSAAQ